MPSRDHSLVLSGTRAAHQRVMRLPPANRWRHQRPATRTHSIGLLVPMGVRLNLVHRWTLMQGPGI